MRDEDSGSQEKMETLIMVKVLGINGVYPEKESILADEPETSFSHQIHDLLCNDTKAKNIIDESGYIAIR